jgi:hypothetical protein
VIDQGEKRDQTQSTVIEKRCPNSAKTENRRMAQKQLKISMDIVRLDKSNFDCLQSLPLRQTNISTHCAEAESECRPFFMLLRFSVFFEASFRSNLNVT